MPPVLYVDDEPELLTLGKLLLEMEGEFSVETAASAQEGLTKLRTGHYDVVISDYLMPDTDGIEFLREVRSEFGHIPFILFTGKGREDVVIEALNQGVDFYLQKGCDPRAQFRELAERIREAVQRVRTDEDLQEKSEELDQFFTLALDLLCIADTEGNFRRLNSAWETTFGYRVEELMGKKFLDLVHPDDLEGTISAFGNMSTGREVVNFVNRFRCKDGAYRWIEWRSFPYGKNLIYGAARDITERKQVEQALKLANKKLNLMAEVTRHDIRNKLTVLGGYLTLLKEYPPKPQASMYIDKLLETTTTIADHIEFTRLYQNLGVVAPCWQNIQNTFFRACTHVDLRQVHVRSELEKLEVFADPLLERVFYNLVDNTLRHGGTQVTSISLDAIETSDGLFIMFEDNGAGIPVQDKEKVFRRGYGKNTGLGLFLAREILSITGIMIRETGEFQHGVRYELHVPKGSYRIMPPSGLRSGNRS